MRPSARRATQPRRPNRSDLNGPEAITTAPGQGYGEAAAQRAAQQVVPMGGQPIAGGAAAAGVRPQPTAPAPLANVGANGPLTRPTERPNEPVTHGLPMGPGAGPEALQGIGAAAREQVMGQATMQQLLTNMTASPTATTALRALAETALGGRQ